MAEYNDDTLKKLASNPHYAMGSSELRQIARLQDRDWEGKKANNKVVKHDPTFEKNDTEIKKEGDDEPIS